MQIYVSFLFIYFLFFFFCIHQCGAAGPSLINVGLHDPMSLYLVLIL